MKKMISYSFSAHDTNETHRASTPLELMFDLAAVIAIAAAAHGLVHAITHDHIANGVIGFLCSFLMIWLAWMNYTWFASAYDDDSTLFRLLSMGMMFGALILAAGIDAVFSGERIWLALLGFIIMRVFMVIFWLGAARGDSDHRRTALRYAKGLGLIQLYWVGLIFMVLPTSVAYLPLFILGVVIELAIPAYAEHYDATAWHRHHIIERYGLLNIIVLGECFIAIVAMISLAPGHALPEQGHFILAILSAVIAFAMWGLYFTDEDHLASDQKRHAMIWGYGHFFVFAGGAATGAGMVVSLEIMEGISQAGAKVGALSIGIPLAVYITALWFIRDRLQLDGWGRWLLPLLAGVIVIVAALAPEPIAIIATLLVLTTFLRRRLTRVYNKK